MITAAPAAASTALPLTWLMLRTTGVIALTMLTISVFIGILSPAVRRPAVRLSMVSVHNAAAASGVLLLIGHVIFAVADSYVTISPLAVVVPGLSDWQPLWVGLGAVAFDLMMIILITSLTRLRAPIAWRRFHVLAYPAWALAWGHALTSGTDAASRPMLVLAVVGFGAVAAASLIRLVRPANTRADRGLTAPTGAPAAPETRVTLTSGAGR